MTCWRLSGTATYHWGVSSRCRQIWQRRRTWRGYWYHYEI